MASGKRRRRPLAGGSNGSKRRPGKAKPTGLVRVLITGAIVLIAVAVAARRLFAPLRTARKHSLTASPEDLTPADQRALSDTIRRRER